MSENLSTARCSTPFDTSVIMVHLHLWEVDGCFILIHAKSFFSGHFGWTGMINSAEDDDDGKLVG